MSLCFKVCKCMSWNKQQLHLNTFLQTVIIMSARRHVLQIGIYVYIYIVGYWCPIMYVPYTRTHVLMNMDLQTSCIQVLAALNTPTNTKAVYVHDFHTLKMEAVGFSETWQLVARLCGVTNRVTVLHVGLYTQLSMEADM